MGNIKPLPRLGQTGEALFKSRGSTWWAVNAPEDDALEGRSGSYAPFGAILADDARNVFPDIDVPDGTVVKVRVEVVYMEES